MTLELELNFRVEGPAQGKRSGPALLPRAQHNRKPQSAHRVHGFCGGRESEGGWLTLTSRVQAWATRRPQAFSPQ